MKVRGSPVSGITMEQGMTLGSNVIDIVHDVDSMTTAAGLIGQRRRRPATTSRAMQQ